MCRANMQTALLEMYRVRQHDLLISIWRQEARFGLMMAV
jgi:hypothetical protein